VAQLMNGHHQQPAKRQQCGDQEDLVRTLHVAVPQGTPACAASPGCEV
jgi:hypothetical protein